MAAVTPTCRRALQHLLAMKLAVLSGAFALVGHSQSDAANADSSISQVRDTLQNLLRSVEDAGHEAEALYTKRQLWCTTALHNFDATSSGTDTALVQLHEDLTEHEAAVEEAVGTVRQVQADIALVEHTINQTQELLQARQHAEASEVEKGHIALKELQSRSAEGNTVEMKARLLQTRSKMKSQFEADARLLGALVENKQKGLASLKGQLDVALPALAQLQAKVAETRERIQDRTDTVSASNDFSTALRHACSAGAKRADAQAAVRMAEAASVEAALQALEGFNGEVQEKTRVPMATDGEAAEGHLEDGEVNFLQVGQGEGVTTEDLVDLFSGGHDQTVDTEFANDDFIQHVQVSGAPTTKQLPQSRPVALAPLKSLLVKLKSSASADFQHQAWCVQEREQNEFTLKVAQDAVAQLASEVEAHSDSEAELTEDLSRINASIAALFSIKTEVSKSESQEQAFLKRQVKDQQLATKILAQASTIIGEVSDTSHHLKQQKKIVGALNEAAAAFRTQLQSASSFEKELAATTKNITRKATVAADVLSHEKRSAEMTRDEHTSQRLQTIASKQAGDEEVKEATQYLQTLAHGCKSDAFEGVGQETKAQIHALEDAETVLEGKRLSVSSGEVRGLRGGAVKKPIRKRPLTPMERAAAEMGVDVDTSDD